MDMLALCSRASRDGGVRAPLVALDSGAGAPWALASGLRCSQGGSALVGCGPPAAGSGGSRTRCGGGVVAAPRSPRARRQPRSRVHRESRGYVPNFCWNFNRRRGALRGHTSEQGSPRRMRLASVSYRTLAPSLQLKPFHSLCAAGRRRNLSFNAFVQPALPSTQLAGAKPAQRAPESWAGSQPTRPPLPARRRANATSSERRRWPAGAALELLSQDKDRAERRDKTGPWPRTSTIH